MAAKPESKPEEAAAAPAGAAGAGGGGIKPWLPFLANLVLMPVLAYFTVTFFLNPKSAKSSEEPVAKAEAGAKSESKEKKSEGKESAGAKGVKVPVPLSDKVLVNLSGSQGTRYILARIALVGSAANFKEMVEHNDYELRDAAMSVLSTKTISDLEKPDSRNVVRAELVSVFNTILGEGAVKEIFLIEFAIQ